MNGIIPLTSCPFSCGGPDLGNLLQLAELREVSQCRFWLDARWIQPLKVSWGELFPTVSNGANPNSSGKLSKRPQLT
jgi:hypothetical protein